MLKYRLPAALATALLLATFGPAQAQDKDAAHQPGQQAGTAPQTPAGAPKPADQAKTPAPTDVVGSVYGKQITWADLLERIRKDQPAQFNQIASQVAGPKVVANLFGPNSQPQVTLTQEDILSAIRQTPPAPIMTFLDQTLLTEAFKEQAAKDNITITDQQVQDYIGTTLKRLRAQGAIPKDKTDQQWLQDFYKQQGITQEQLMNNVRQSMIPYALFEKEVGKQLGHPVSSADYVQIRQLLIKAPQLTSTSTAADKKADAEARAKAERIAAEIKAGKKTFAQAVKESSEDFASKQQGGEIPPFMRGTQSKEIEAEAFTLKPNEVSKPIRSAVGYYLIQVAKSGNDLPEDQRQALLRARENQSSSQYVQALRQRANIVNNLRPIAGVGGPGGIPVQGGGAGAAGAPNRQ